MDLTKLKLGDKIIFGCGIVLLIDLLFLPWHKFGGGCFGEGAFRACADSVSRSAIQSPNSFWGILALLMLVAIVAVVFVERLTSTELPALPVGMHQAIFFGCIALLVLLFLKVAVETTGLAWGAYLAILLAGGMVYGGFLLFQAGEAEGGSPGTGSAPPQPF